MRKAATAPSGVAMSMPQVHIVAYCNDLGYGLARGAEMLSLMLGFVARAAGTEIEVDGVEIEYARWFTRDELTAAVDAGEVVLPGEASIAHRLIADWRAGTSVSLEA